MNSRSIVLIGGPDTGKTNFVGRLWHALKAGNGSLSASEIPDDITFAEDTLAHLLGGTFAPRSEWTEERRDFQISVVSASGGPETRIVIPDISGELWRKAVLSSELDADWMDELHRADGAILFVRVLSEQNEQPLDWVTSRRLLAEHGAGEKPSVLPTQVMLCELLRFLELSLSNRVDGSRPRVAIVVSAWDLVDREIAVRGPEAFLASDYPLFAGRLRDVTRLDVQVFGLSVVGGDIGVDAAYREAFFDRPFGEHGWVAIKDAESGEWRNNPDVTLPVAWVVGA